MKALAHWVPAAFCGFICYIALTAVKGSASLPGEWWRPAFFSFLPMCFFFVGNVTWQMYRELTALRARVAELEARQMRLPLL